MCGIAGCLTARAEGDRLAREVAAMTRAMAHRGPDDEGLLFWRRGTAAVGAATDHTVDPLRGVLAEAPRHYDQPWQIVLGHRRFSILDVTAAGHQPFVDPQGRAALVFNGEIYNFVELRSELEKLGAVFQTRSDTEVLLQAYLHWGDAMLPRLNGMWAFGLLDFRTGRVLLARDRIGEKSLYFTRVDDRLYFASEIKALFVVPEIWARRQVDDDLVRDYLFFGLRDHTHASFFAGISNLPPASYAWLEGGSSVVPQAYWKLPTVRRSERDIGYEEAQRQLALLMADSVGIRLRADVPLAADLSGGMDSTTMVAFATRRLREQNAEHRLRTFTVRYEDERFDESAYASATAAMTGAEFNSITPSSNDYWSSVEPLMRSLEQPYDSPNLLSVKTSWTVMKRDGIRVVLNGGAGDELLAGYIGSHLLPCLQELLLSGRATALWRELRAWRGTGYLTPVALRRQLQGSLLGSLHRYSLERRLLQPEFSVFAHPPGAADRLGWTAQRLRPSNLSATLAANVNITPMPRYMVQCDKLSMGLPIEVRFPFLDYRVIDFAFQLPVTYLIRNGFSKAILRETARGLIPSQVINRREKMGFPVPLRQWMEEGLHHIRRDLLNTPRTDRFFSAERVLASVEKLSAYSIWRIHQVELWMRVFDLH